MDLRLGYHYHIPARQEDGKIVMPGYHGCFIDSLAERCEKLICFLHSPNPADSFNGDYTIHSKNVVLVDIGLHTSVPKRIINARHFTQSLLEKRGELDAVLLRGPSPLLPAFAKATGQTPTAMLLVGDYLAVVDDLPQPWWRKELIRLWSKWNQAQQLKIARRSLTFVNSHKLYEELKPFVPNLVETHTTTLSEADFFLREDTCQKPPYHLLYTGRMDRGKGLMEMIEALAKLTQKGYDCVLDLVGMKVKGDPILQEIQRKGQELGITERIIYHGYVPLGKQLFDFYRKADIYVIASKSSFEGFPRTIWEAMANSLPVVATRVGSIADFLNGAALIIEPAKTDELASAIISLLSNQELRRRNIKTGRSTAKENTLENRSKELISNIKEFVNKQ
jgi:glycosyltransferase involved in cell wall biosynthesis